VAAGLAVLALDRPAALLALCCITALPLLFIRIDRRWRGAGLLAVLALMWSTTLSQGLFYADVPRVAVARLGPLTLYREGLLHGLAQSLRLIAVTLGGLALSLSTPPDRLFAALQALRVPFGVAFLAVTALRFVPEVGREWWTVRAARAARGRPMWRRGPIAWVVEEVSLLRPVVARSLRRARALAESLDARGFDPLAPRTRYRPLHMPASEALLVTLALLLAALLVAARLCYVAYTADLLYIPALRPIYGLVRDWL
jgi:energy-coupling factor transport system permease protein